MRYILALDQGTTSSRAILFDEKAHIVGVSQKEFTQIFPHPGHVEHNPMEIWSSQIAVAAQVIAGAGIRKSDILGIGITNQRETTIVWDKSTSKPICNAIVWQDRRTLELCQELRQAGYEPLFQKKTGLLLDPYFSGTKITWILDNIPGARAKAERGDLLFGTVDSWLLWKLTGGKVHATDVTNASRTLLMDLQTLAWDDQLLQILRIPKNMLPEIKPCCYHFGDTDSSLLGSSVPILGMAGDQQAAMIGQTCFKKGMVKNTYGTGCFLLMHTGNTPKVSKNKLLTTVAYQIKGETAFALEGSVFIAGAAVQWLRDALGIIKSAEEVESLAKQVKTSEGVYFVPAFTGLGAPYWDPKARGIIVGLSRGSTKSHIARAALEGIAFQVYDVLKAMESDAGIKVDQLRVDGGASKDSLLMQIQADIIEAKVVRPFITESTALGAAYLVGLEKGVWQSTQELFEKWEIEQVYTPGADQMVVKELLSHWKKAIRCAQAWEDR